MIKWPRPGNRGRPLSFLHDYKDMSNTKKVAKKRIAVFIGGRSPEHDVSVVTGLQVLAALDPARFEGFPVYITPGGRWLTGDVLRQKSNFLLTKNSLKKTQDVTLDITTGRTGRLLPLKKSLLGGGPAIEFDVAIPAFHGLFGEDGCIQGLFEMAGVPYIGPRVMAASVFMDKAATKKFLKALDIPHLPYAVLRRPAEGYFIPKDELEKLAAPVGFPCIIKPSHLGSSIGVAKVKDIDELSACLPAVFEYDDAAILEPFVQNLVEYNVAVARMNGAVTTSAIERPKATAELLDFKQKYLSGGGSKSGTKTPGQSSEGMLSLTRELNPQLDAAKEKLIRDCAARLFTAIEGTGAPRIDFMGDTKTGGIWMNEINPLPGSFGYFLWEAAANPVLFSDFLTALIEEALTERRKKSLPADPVPKDARLLNRSVE